MGNDVGSPRASRGIFDQLRLIVVDDRNITICEALQGNASRADSEQHQCDNTHQFWNTDTVGL